MSVAGGLVKSDHKGAARCHRCGTDYVGYWWFCEIIVYEGSDDKGEKGGGITYDTDSKRSIALLKTETVREVDEEGGKEKATSDQHSNRQRSIPVKPVPPKRDRGTVAAAAGAQRQDVYEAQAQQWLDGAYELALERMDRVGDTMEPQSWHDLIGTIKPTGGTDVGCYGLVLEFCVYCHRVLLEDCPRCEAESEALAGLAAAISDHGVEGDQDREFPFRCTFFYEPGRSAHAHCAFAAFIDAQQIELAGAPADKRGDY